jgi:hypothetical protein
MTRLEDLLLTGLAVLACSCTAQPSGSGQKADSSASNGGKTTESSGLGGGGHGSGGTAGAAGGSREVTGGMGGGGQAGSSGSGGSGAGGSGSGGASADAATNRDTTADLPANPDAPVKSDAAADFWTTQFVANCTPPPIGGRSQTDGHHRAGEDCMQSGCHMGGSPDAGAAFLFGGTVRRAGSLALYPSVEVAVKTKSEFYSACSATNGNFWVVSADAGSLDWSSASPRVRSSNGEGVMSSTTPVAGCNSCHSEILLMTAP